jgi:hypothetical protein
LLLFFSSSSSLGLKFTHTVYRGSKHEKNDVVRFTETRQGVRKVKKDQHLFSSAIILVLLGSGLLYLGVAGKVPEFMYWPPRVRSGW